MAGTEVSKRRYWAPCSLASGQPERARELTERTLAMVIAGGGPNEYYNPHAAAKPPRAVTMFSWTAALYLDLAVSLSGEGE